MGCPRGQLNHEGGTREKSPLISTVGKLKLYKDGDTKGPVAEQAAQGRAWKDFPSQKVWTV